MTSDFKLKEYYRFIQVSGFITAFAMWAMILFFPAYFLFLGQREEVLFLFSFIWVIHLFSFALQTVMKEKSVFTFLRFVWLVFFALLYVTSGGITSPLLYLLVFPIAVSGIDLSTRDMKIMIALVVGLLCSLFLFEWGIYGSFTYVMHAFNIVNFFILSCFIYQMIKEKKEIHRDFGRLQDLEHLKSDFITVASNRLRSPLSAVLGVLSELREGGVDEQKRKEFVEGGYEKIQIAISAVNELVETVELDAYHLKALPEMVNVRDMVQEIVGDMESIAKEKEVSVHFDVPAVFTIRAHPKIMKFALENIINNAISYSPKGEVEIGVMSKDRFCQIVVRDNGIGITSEDLPLVFDRLYRGKRAMSIEPNRSGIGMYSAKRIIELHEGTIAVQSIKEKGTTVTILLPMI